MSRNPYAERRPGGVIFVIALTWIVAFLSVVSGFLTLMGQDSPVAGSAVDAGQPTWYGTVEIGFGVVTALVAIGLARGSDLARLLVTALMVLRVDLPHIAACWAPALSMSVTSDATGNVHPATDHRRREGVSVCRWRLPAWSWRYGVLECCVELPGGRLKILVRGF